MEVLELCIIGRYQPTQHLFVCLHLISCLYTIFVGSMVWMHFTCSILCLLGTTYFSIEENSINVVSMVDQRLFELSAAAQQEKNPGE